MRKLLGATNVVNVVTVATIEKGFECLGWRIVLYLLDANILITPANTYYGITRVPEFWTWLEHQGSAGYIQTPIEMYEEVLEGRKEGDELLDWVKKDAIRRALLFEEASNPDLVRKVIREGYSNDLTDDEVEKIGLDPFLISYGMIDGDREH